MSRRGGRLNLSAQPGGKGGTKGAKLKCRANYFPVSFNIPTLHRYTVVFTDEIQSMQLREKVVGKCLPSNVVFCKHHNALFTTKLMESDSQWGEGVVKLVNHVEISVGALKNQYLKGSSKDFPEKAIDDLNVFWTALGRKIYNNVVDSVPLLKESIPLGDGIEVRRVFKHGLRLLTEMGLSMRLDVSTGNFFLTIRVTEFIERNYVSMVLSDQDRVQLGKVLTGITVECDNGRFKKRYQVIGVSREPLSMLTFTLDGKKTSVVDYFKNTYGIKFDFLNLPAIQAGTDSNPVFLPMERYKEQLNKKQLVSKSKAKFPHLKKDIEQIVKKIQFHCDKIFPDFCINIAEDSVVVSARVLPPPVLKYKDIMGRSSLSICQPNKGQWSWTDKKMYCGGQVQHWAIVNFSDRMNSSRLLVSQFVNKLVAMCRDCGMIFNDGILIPETPNRSIEDILDDIYNQYADNVQLLIIVLPDVGGSYGKIKLRCETKLGIISQCVRPESIRKWINNNEFYRHLALKINVKVGGVNHVLHDAINRNIAHVTDQGKKTIIFGADLTHPDKWNVSDPSVAAVVATVDWPELTKYKAAFSVNPHGKEIIEHLDAMIRELLGAFNDIHREMPERVIFYRDGVNDTQFGDVMRDEVLKIKNVLTSLEVRNKPTLTFVVLHKESRTILFPPDGSKNIDPGTVVDTTICHHQNFNFYLRSHAGDGATHHLSRYWVLLDENHFTSDELQALTYNLCHTCVTCSRSLSIVTPVWYAHKAAFRVHEYFQASRSENIPVELPTIKKNVKDVMFYC